ncbi:MAG TPA: histidine kinase [Solirubrobacteraceae bacterium]|nr:histidine kinase [Solirubrobacteraceae bacterium]
MQPPSTDLSLSGGGARTAAETAVHEPPAEAAPASRDERAAGGLRARGERVSLLWRVFAANTVVFVVAVALLAWTPVTVHRVATPGELAILAAGLLAMLAANLFLLRRTFSPLRRLAALMGAVDPGQPGRRAPTPSGGREVMALARALNGMLDRLEGERRESGRRALAAQERERARIARELHDEIGQTLTAIALRAERAAREDGSQTEALHEIAATVHRSLEDVRRIGRELRPEALDDLGLTSALVALCSRIDHSGGLRVHRRLDWHLPSLPDEVELVIYRVAQEALTNVLRHAGARTATVELGCAAGSVRLAVRDDGRGLPAERSERGLLGMRERAMLIGADLRISSAPGQGTEIVLSVRIDPDAAPGTA